MVVAVVSCIILLLCGAVVFAIAKDRGPGPDDVAVSYERAWDRLDFAALFVLSASELRDGLDRRGFVAAKRAAYADRSELRGLVENVVTDDVAVRGEHAIVTTRVELHDGGVVHNRVELVRRTSRWQVYGYAVAPAPAVTPGAD
ncbi:MAG: hypothetical protein ACHQIG_08425 [Acidimicrobiia bacterium]